MSGKYNQKVFDLVFNFFGGNIHKVKLWLKIDNPMLGYISPETMMKTGRGEKLLKIVKEAIDENKLAEKE